MYWIQWSRSAGLFKRAFLVDDADGRLMRADGYLLYVFRGPARPLQFAVQRHGAFHSGLRMKFGGKGYLEEHMFHHIRTVGTLEF